VARALDGEAQPGVLEYLERAQELLDRALHAVVTEAARGAECVAIGPILHLVDGCRRARSAHPLAADEYRGRAPRSMTGTEGDRWLASGPRRKRCGWCWR